MILDHGSPEPDRATFWRDTRGNLWQWDPVEEAWYTRNYGCEDWDGIRSYLFPLTQEFPENPHQYPAYDDAVSDVIRYHSELTRERAENDRLRAELAELRAGRGHYPKEQP